jgi:hypothetical protein
MSGTVFSSSDGSLSLVRLIYCVLFWDALDWSGLNWLHLNGENCEDSFGQIDESDQSCINENISFPHLPCHVEQGLVYTMVSGRLNVVDGLRRTNQIVGL